MSFTVRRSKKMPYFSEHKLLFLHIPKNAGRSIESALLGGVAQPASKGRRTLPGRLANAALKSATPDFVNQRLMGTLDVTLAAQHLTYAELELLGLLNAASYEIDDIIYVCRDPFDRALSSVTHFMGKQPDAATFEKSLETWLARTPKDHNDLAHRRPQYHFITNRRGEPVSAHQLRFERLKEDFDAFLSARGIGGIDLPWRGRHADARDSRDIYSQRSRQLVEAAFAEDLEGFGYQF